MSAPDVTIREVALRDGLQIETPISLSAKIELLEAIVATGVREVEATAFVSGNGVGKPRGILSYTAGTTIARRNVVPRKLGHAAALCNRDNGIPAPPKDFFAASDLAPHVLPEKEIPGGPW